MLFLPSSFYCCLGHGESLLYSAWSTICLQLKRCRFALPVYREAELYQEALLSAAKEHGHVCV